MPHTSHNVIDADKFFSIDPKTRSITFLGDQKLKLIQEDHNSERVTFAVPRHIDGHDMLTCTNVEVHYNNISVKTGEESPDVYPVDDVQVSPDSEDVVIFSWLISGNATRYAGILAVLISFKCTTGDSIDYAWHTDIYSDITVGEGMNNGEAIIQEYSDILARWQEEIDRLASCALVDLEQTQTSTESGGVNVWTATFGDGRQKTFKVRNGEAGEDADLPNLATKEEVKTAREKAEAAIIKAEMAESIAKGANEAIPFDSEHQMLSWIKEQKAKDIDTVKGVFIPSDGEYYMVVAVDRTLVEAEDEYGDKHFIFPDSCDITVEYDDGTVENYLYNGYNINGFKCVFVNNGRLYATVPLLNGKSVEIVYSNFYDGNYAVTGNSGGSTNKNPTYRLISPSMGVDVTEHDLALTDAPIVVTISSDDKTLRSLTYMYDIKAVTDFYIRDENVPDYWWDGANIYKLETDKANLTPIEDGLRNILHAINNIL